MYGAVEAYRPPKECLGESPPTFDLASPLQCHRSIERVIVLHCLASSSIEQIFNNIFVYYRKMKLQAQTALKMLKTQLKIKKILHMKRRKKKQISIKLKLFLIIMNVMITQLIKKQMKKFVEKIIIKILTIITKI